MPAEVPGHKGVFSNRASASPSPSRSRCILLSTIPDRKALFQNFGWDILFSIPSFLYLSKLLYSLFLLILISLNMT